MPMIGMRPDTNVNMGIAAATKKGTLAAGTGIMATAESPIPLLRNQRMKAPQPAMSGWKETLSLTKPASGKHQSGTDGRRA
jgi:hypothetical protein